MNLAADEEVPPHGLLFPERLVLVDGFDSQRVRLLHGIGVRVDPVIRDVQVSARGRENPRENLDQRRFAGAIVADETDDLIVADLEVDIFQGAHRSEVLLDVDHAQRGALLGRFSHEAISFRHRQLFCTGVGVTRKKWCNVCLLVKGMIA